MGYASLIKDNNWNSIRWAINKLDTKLGSNSSPTFVEIALTGATDHGLLLGAGTDPLTSLAVAANGEIPIGSAGADPILATITGTANQVISTPGVGSITLSLPQNIHTGASPTFAGGTFTGVVTGISPIVGEHFATKEYVDMAIGTELDFFLSDTASGIGSNYLMYEQETGEGQSTLTTAAAYPSGLGVGDDQLVFSFLTEAGHPNILYLRDGIYDAHLHLNNNTGNKPTIIYWTLSYVDADGSANETLVVVSELSNEITDSDTAYNLHAVLSPEVSILATKRLLVKIYANVSSGGGNSVITLTMEGTTDSHVTIEAPSSIWQRHGIVLDDINTVGQVGADSEFLVGTGAGVFAWESGATARTSIGLGTGDSPTFNTLILATIVAESSDVDKFLVHGGGSFIKYRTGTQVLSDIGAATSGHNHSGVYEPADAGLTSLAGLTYVSDSFIKVTATDIYAIRTLSEVRTDLGLVIGTDVLAYDVGLADLAGVAMQVDRYYYTSGDNVHVAGTITSAGRAILDDANAAAQATTLGLGVGDSPTFVSVTLTGLLNLPATTSSVGQLKIDSAVILHTFHHPTGDTVVPDGHNIFLGEDAGNYTLGSTATNAQEGSYNVCVSYQSSPALTTGYKNVLISSTSGLQSGFQNVALGYQALNACVTQWNNMAIGTAALGALTLGTDTIAIGTIAALYQANGSTILTSSYFSVYIGSDTRGKDNSDFNTIVIGYQAIGIGANKIRLGNTSITQTQLSGSLSIGEIAAAPADTGGYGQLWIKNTSPGQLWFTDDLGTDTRIV
ncbi:hypothetical protein LCGC14_1415730 [marine sediment metagenome]|uniref:Uncharacterized protein n=1 Tax=marine sediment metagenome TaxID=412755 RepID=A0A0F9M8F1_9ZZZZ